MFRSPPTTAGPGPPARVEGAEQSLHLGGPAGRVDPVLEVRRRDLDARLVDGDRGEDGHTAADAGLRRVAVEPHRSSVGESHDARVVQLRPSEHGVAVKPTVVGCSRGLDALHLVTGPELDELDAVRVGTSQRARQLRRDVGVPRTDHARVELGDQRHVGGAGAQKRSQGGRPAASLDVPGRDAHPPVEADALCTHGLARRTVQALELGQQTGVELGVAERAGPHGALVGRRCSHPAIMHATRRGALGAQHGAGARGACRVRCPPWSTAAVAASH